MLQEVLYKRISFFHMSHRMIITHRYQKRIDNRFKNDYRSYITSIGVMTRTPDTTDRSIKKR